MVCGCLAVEKTSAAPSVGLRDNEKFSTHLRLDSDEESMQGYIQNLSDLDSTPGVTTPKTPRVSTVTWSILSE